MKDKTPGADATPPPDNGDYVCVPSANPFAATPRQKHYCGNRSGCLWQFGQCPRHCCWRPPLAAPALKSASSGNGSG